MKKILCLLAIGTIFCGARAEARENVTDWYIQDFRTEITVKKDSSLDITEYIAADCGSAAGKHGIFRILPEETKLNTGEKIKNPVKLIAITDFEGKKIKFSESRSRSDKTVTWKIGDPNKTVQGINYYKIHYVVENAIRFAQPDFDELYWNLNGNFWELEIDHFTAKIIFPEGINESNSRVEYYTGATGSREKYLARYKWSEANVLEFETTGKLSKREGVTASVIFPKNVITPYKLGFWAAYGPYLFFLFPLIAFIFCFRLWKKYGKDPKVDKAIVPEYDVPGKLTPMEMGMLQSNGTFSQDLVTAEIINLAAKGLLTIEETKERILLFNVKDHLFRKKPDPAKEQSLNAAQRKILDKIFESGEKVKLSDLKNTFYEILEDIEEKSRKSLEKQGLLAKTGFQMSAWFIVAGIILAVFSIILFAAFDLSFYFLSSFILSGLIIFIFGFVMPKRTLAGAEINWQIKGFKMFMETVDKDRAAFYEKENIFEKFLPYAIVFDITDLWIKKAREIYGEEYFKTHAPVWYVGGVSSFDAQNFSSALDSLSSSISSNTSSPSGSGGSGGSGGGGGGGGGGGW